MFQAIFSAKLFVRLVLCPINPPGCREALINRIDPGNRVLTAINLFYCASGNIADKTTKKGSGQKYH